MTGGKFTIPLDVQSRSIWWKRYISEYNNGIFHSYVEKIQKNYATRFFIDIDHVNETACQEDVKVFVKNACDVVKTKRAIVCSNTKSNNLHIIFPDTAFTVEQCADNARQLIEKCTFGDIDASVYNTGLRIILSTKKSDPQMYIPTWLYANESWSLIGKVTIRIAMLTSIHTNVSCEIPVDTKCLAPQTSKTCSMSNTIRGACQKALQTVHNAYTDTKITGIRVEKNYTTIYTNSTYCTNTGNCHKSATVYFVISKRSISQRCFCRCANKTCKTFKSESKPLPWVTYFLLRER